MAQTASQRRRTTGCKPLTGLDIPMVSRTPDKLPNSTPEVRHDQSGLHRASFPVGWDQNPPGAASPNPQTTAAALQHQSSPQKPQIPPSQAPRGTRSCGRIAVWTSRRTGCDPLTNLVLTSGNPEQDPYIGADCTDRLGYPDGFPTARYTVKFYTQGSP